MVDLGNLIFPLDKHLFCERHEPDTLSSKTPYRLCIIGNNAKSVAAATALAYFGHTVHFSIIRGKKNIKRYV